MKQHTISLGKILFHLQFTVKIFTLMQTDTPMQLLALLGPLESLVSVCSLQQTG